MYESNSHQDTVSQVRHITATNGKHNHLLLICFYLEKLKSPRKAYRSVMDGPEPIPNNFIWLVHKRDMIPSYSVLTALLEGDEWYYTPLSWPIYKVQVNTPTV